MYCVLQVHGFTTCQSDQLWLKTKRRAPNNGVRDTVNPFRSCYIWVLNDDLTHLY